MRLNETRVTRQPIALVHDQAIAFDQILAGNANENAVSDHGAARARQIAQRFQHPLVRNSW